MALFYLRLLGIVLWAAVALALLPSAWRYLTGPASQADEWRVGVLFTALVFVGSLGRWIFLPDAPYLFEGLSALSCALAAFFLILSAQGRRK